MLGRDLPLIGAPESLTQNNSASLPRRFSSSQHADVMPNVIQKLGSLLIGLLQTGFSEEEHERENGIGF
jgi:hypothetical protein